MMQSATLIPSATRPICRCELPEDFGLYIKSWSNVNHSYKFKRDIYSTKNFENGKGMVPNEVISVKDVNEIISRP